MEAEGKKREFVELELKYCERCGGLWLRRKGELAVYCGPCLPKVAEAAIERHLAVGRKVVKDERPTVESATVQAEMDAMLAEFESELERLMVLGVEGGNA